MNAGGKAIFLSYASQDAGPARRICDALRAAGLEVWFDQSELRGGDAWDASIRKKIRECALFVPIVSANTETRSEGYFRLEWKLAVDRSHLMAEDTAFLLPVVVDGTSEATARVPDRFRERQWSRLDGDAALAAFAQRLARLLVPGAAAPAAVPDGTAAGAPAAAAVLDAPGASGAAPSIAVLPFVNMSGDPENEYFADGLAEELLHVLARVPGLRVASRTSAFSFKGSRVDIATVARSLNVGAVLEGSVRKAGKRVRISAQLIRVADDSHLWSETYDRELDDIFAVQDDIAQSVVKELRRALFGPGREPEAAASARADVVAATAGRTGNAEAYRLFLEGRFFVIRKTEADAARGTDCLRRAVAIDPGFALGWAYLSYALHQQADQLWAPFVEGLRNAREAAERALALAPNLAEGHVARGWLHVAEDLDWSAAEAEFRRALEAAPENADAIASVGFLAAVRGRLDESIELARKGVTLDPLNVIRRRTLGVRCAAAGRLDEAEAAYRAALDLDPTAGGTHYGLVRLRLLQGRAAEARESAEAETIAIYRQVGIALAEHSLGNVAQSDAALQQLVNTHADTMAYQIAEICAWRGETDRAFDWLERAFVQRDLGLAEVTIDPFVRSLHADRRWEALLLRMRHPGRSTTDGAGPGDSGGSP